MRLLHVFDSLAPGGTERVVLNRARAAERQNKAIEIDFHVPDASSTAIATFEAGVGAMGLGQRLRFRPHLDHLDYDAVFVMDFPAAFSRFSNAPAPVIAEAHQQRSVLQAYLADLPTFIRLVVTPSDGHSAFVRGFVPPHAGLRVIPNVVFPSEAEASLAAGSGACLGPPQVVFCGRMGNAKDTPELVRVFAGLLAAAPQVSPLIVTPTVAHADTEAMLDALNLRGRVRINRSAGFEAMDQIYREVRASGGVFLSCSRAESFGLAAAEAIAGGVPVVLSDIPAHRALLEPAVRNADAYLFPLGDTAAAVDRGLEVLADWRGAQAAQSPAKARLCDEGAMLDSLIAVVADAKRLQT